MTSLPTNEPNPGLVWGLMTAFQKTAALRAAIDLRLFTVIGDGADTSELIAARCAASPRGIRILCDYMTIEGLLVKQDGHYSLTPTSAVFLNERSPACMGTMVNFINSPKMVAGYANLTEAVRLGTTGHKDGGIAGNEIDEWVTFAKNMTPIARPTAEFVGEVATTQIKPKRVLDIAAGHGLYGIAVATRAPQAEIVAQDWPKVLAVAESNAQVAGVDGRYRLLPGSAFDVEFGSGFDLVLLTNFLHHFNPTVCANFLKKIYTALDPGGRVITVEFAPNEDRVSPPIPAAFSFTMLINTPDGDAYTKSELASMMTAAGFVRAEVMDVPQSVQQLIVSYK